MGNTIAVKLLTEHGAGSDLRLARSYSGLRTVDDGVVLRLPDSRHSTEDGILE